MKLQLFSTFGLSILIASVSAQQSDEARSNPDADRHPAVIGVIDQILGEQAQAPQRQAAFAAEAIDAPWATRMISRIGEHIGGSDLALSALQSECRSTACIIEFTSTVPWTRIEDRERFEAELNERIRSLLQASSPDDLVGVSGRTSFDVEQECRITGRYVLQRYANGTGPVAGPVVLSLAGSERCF